MISKDNAGRLIKHPDTGWSSRFPIPCSLTKRAPFTQPKPHEPAPNIGWHPGGFLKPEEIVLGALTKNLCLPPRGMTSEPVCGPVYGPVGSVTWFPATSRHNYNTGQRQYRQQSGAMSINLIGAILSLAVWFVATFIRPVGLGIIHVFLGIGVVLLIRWWALRTSSPA